MAPTAERPRTRRRNEAPLAAPAATGRGLRPQREPPPTRERLLASAKAEFAQHGFAGARVDRILTRASVNSRMLYHYFGGKSEIYIAVLENALADLRRHELELDVDRFEPLEGLLQLFDFVNDHFESNQALVSLFSNENLLKARFMKKSAKIKEMSSPVTSMISTLILRGQASGALAPDLDPLRVYVLMVALGQFHLSNVHTLSVIFGEDLAAAAWRKARKADARRMLRAFLQAPADEWPNDAINARPKPARRKKSARTAPSTRETHR